MNTSVLEKLNYIMDKVDGNENNMKETLATNNLPIINKITLGNQEFFICDASNYFKFADQIEFAVFNGKLEFLELVSYGTCWTIKFTKKRKLKTSIFFDDAVEGHDIDFSKIYSDEEDILKFNLELAHNDKKFTRQT